VPAILTRRWDRAIAGACAGLGTGTNVSEQAVVQSALLAD
jgi:phage shock protein PspC (stress-responsive transcriptional regulator)